MIVDVFHIALIHTEHAEADVQILGSQRVFFFDFLTGAADALFADFANVFVTCFEGFTVFVAGFGELYHDELAVPAVLGVELHDRVGSGGGAGEEVENDRVSFCCQIHTEFY